jgi:uncharacterized protein (TIGR03083 family)
VRLPDGAAETTRPDRIDLDGEHVGAPARERGRDRPGSRADLHDEVAGDDAGIFDEAVREIRTKEVLPETAAALVSGCPPVGGHGTSPWYSRAHLPPLLARGQSHFRYYSAGVETFEMIAQERRDLADTLSGLDAQQWTTPSLCQGWTVHDVAAHLLMPLVTSAPRLIAAMATSGFNFDRANLKLTANVAQRTNDELVSGLRTNAEHRFKPPGAGPEAPLTDVIVHGQDIRRPLGIHHDIEPAHLTRSLDFVRTPKARGFFPKGLLDGVRLEATDLDWATGSGAVARGTGEAILLTMTGRRAALADLDGPGVELLGPRLAPS